MNLWNHSKWALLFLIVSLFGTTSSIGHAAPSVSGVNGTVSDGASVQVTGSGFGPHGLDVEWTGANIESGNVGNRFSKNNWHGIGENYNLEYASDHVHSGARSIKSEVMSSSVRHAIARYTLPDPVDPGEWIYVTWWARYVGHTNGQWKQLRISRDDTVVDGPAQIAYFNWFQQNDMININPLGPGQKSAWTGDKYVKGDGKWYRQETIVRASTIGSSNGIINLNRYGNGSYTAWNSGPLATLVSAGDKYRYVIFQNYLGNGIGSGQIWLDDIYISRTQARVEICNTATWAARTHCEVQAPTAWSDTSVTFSANTGSLSNATGYLYLVNDNGTSNPNGYSIAIDGSANGGFVVPNNLQAN